MFNILEKKSERRIFYSYLHRFELTQDHLGPKVSRQLLNEIYKRSNAVSRRFDEPVASVSRNIISTAAWGAIYCMLGPTRMIEIEPEYQQIADEVEMELMDFCSEEAAENSIYRKVFSILADNSLCHPEVMTLIEACMLDSSREMALQREISAVG